MPSCSNIWLGLFGMTTCCLWFVRYSQVIYPQFNQFIISFHIRIARIGLCPLFRDRHASKTNVNSHCQLESIENDHVFKHLLSAHQFACGYGSNIEIPEIRGMIMWDFPNAINRPQKLIFLGRRQIPHYLYAIWILLNLVMSFLYPLPNKKPSPNKLKYSYTVAHPLTN